MIFAYVGRIPQNGLGNYGSLSTSLSTIVINHNVNSADDLVNTIGGMDNSKYYVLTVPNGKSAKTVSGIIKGTDIETKDKSFMYKKSDYTKEELAKLESDYRTINIYKDSNLGYSYSLVIDGVLYENITLDSLHEDKNKNEITINIE